MNIFRLQAADSAVRTSANIVGCDHNEVTTAAARAITSYTRAVAISKEKNNTIVSVFGLLRVLVVETL